MTDIKKSLFWLAFYLSIILGLGQLDFAGHSVINFSSYFYILTILVVPSILFINVLGKGPMLVPMILWASIYIALSEILDRSLSASGTEFQVVILEFVLIQITVWLSYNLAREIGRAESVLDALALSTFPNRALDMDSAADKIKVELTRSRRYHRPLTLMVLETNPEDHQSMMEMVKNIQYDLAHRFSLARIGQIIGDGVRQTDLVVRDHTGRFIVICPETDMGYSAVLAERLKAAVENSAGINIQWGVAAFPEEALTFEDLLQKARDRLTEPVVSQAVVQELNERLEKVESG
jgi:hypothetical protein